jgi:Kef-type K+ transport system membrane component KefB
MILLAAGLGIIALSAHSVSTRVFGGRFGMSAEDSSLSAILLFPLGEFVVIIATVAVAVFEGPEAKLLKPLAFLLILITVVLFQPFYNLRQLHQKIMSKIPRIPTPVQQTVIKQHTPETLKQAKKIGLNAFVILCFAWVTILLYNALPNFNVPVHYSRQATAALVFIFFASLPALEIAKAFRKISKINKQPLRVIWPKKTP